METGVVFLPKSGTIKHSIAKDYTCPLISTQYAHRESRPSETALHRLAGKIELQLKAKGYISGIFLDIEEPFDCISMKAIEEAKTKHGVPKSLVD
ncbi:hypothetical protein KM043_015975 [Ampulex compressa]|nr:hypothetical protein KM043_015975 [Ampulex compressa]